MKPEDLLTVIKGTALLTYYDNGNVRLLESGDLLVFLRFENRNGIDMWYVLSRRGCCWVKAFDAAVKTQPC